MSISPSQRNGNVVPSRQLLPKLDGRDSLQPQGGLVVGFSNLHRDMPVMSCQCKRHLL